MNELENSKIKDDFVGKNCALCGTYPPDNHEEFDGEFLCGRCALEVYYRISKKLGGRE